MNFLQNAGNNTEISRSDERLIIVGVPTVERLRLLLNKLYYVTIQIERVIGKISDNSNWVVARDLMIDEFVMVRMRIYG